MTSNDIDLTRPSAVSVPAPAKVNLILRILDRRPDGFHNLWSVMQTVRLEDEVLVRLNARSDDIKLHCDSQTLTTDHTNLVYRAAAAVLQRSKQMVGLDITLIKRIPMGAGLGGGSSDAAATILALNHILDLGWSATDMADVGQTLGSDVPFFFFAPSAVVSGRGEHVGAIELTGSRWVVLVNPGFSIETKWAYQQLSTTRSHLRPLSGRHAALAQNGKVSWEQIVSVAENDFEIPVFQAHPQLQEIKTELLQAEAEVALLSGSGATVFGVFPTEAKAKQAMNRFSIYPQYKVFAVSADVSPLLCRLV